MSNADKPACPNCGRPMGFNYVDVEPGKCQLWRLINEAGSASDIPPRTMSDCFGLTSRRIRELNAKVAELETSKKAAQRALDRHHEAKRVKADPFPDNARIE